MKSRPRGRSHHRLPESKKNITLGGGAHVKRFRLYEASHRLLRGRVMRQPFSVKRLRNELYIGPYIHISNHSVRARVIRALEMLHLSQRYRLPRAARAGAQR